MGLALGLSLSIVGGSAPSGNSPAPATSVALARTDGATFTSAGTTHSKLCNIGAAAVDRLVSVPISARAGSVIGAATVTIAGQVISIPRIRQANGTVETAVYEALVPTGTTAQIDVVYPISVARGGFNVYTVRGANVSSGPTASSAPATSGDVVLSVPMTGAGGVIAAVYTGNSSSGQNVGCGSAIVSAAGTVTADFDPTGVALTMTGMTTDSIVQLTTGTGSGQNAGCAVGYYPA